MDKTKKKYPVPPGFPTHDINGKEMEYTENGVAIDHWTPEDEADSDSAAQEFVDGLNKQAGK
jgi:hypothetical protein